MILNETLWLLIIGLAAGFLGGLLGIGGSVIMIPMLTIALGKNHHLSQAAAMIVNLFVSAPALLSHHRARAVRWRLVRLMLPAGLVFILIGVLVSNLFDGELLEKLFGIFLLYVVVTNLLHITRVTDETPLELQRTSPLAMSIVAAITGFMAGLLGIGGGLVAVPLLQRVCRLPLRQAIATTAAMMCVTATIGAFLKCSTLHTLTDPLGESLHLTAMDAIRVAAFLAPTAILGGLFGAKLTHKLPLPIVRTAFILLMMWACYDMLELSAVVAKLFGSARQ